MAFPLREPPSGVNSNFSHPPFLGTPVLVAAGIVLPLITIFATARIYTTTMVLKRWKIEDYLYMLTCSLGVALIAFSISVVTTGAIGHHAWDVDSSTLPKSALLSLFGFWIALGPMSWLIKLTLFSLLIRTFGSVRWLKNSAWIGIIVSGLIFSSYTVVATIACGPRGDSDTQSYLNSLNRHECSGSTGANAIMSILTSIVNTICNVSILLLSYPLLSSLNLQAKQFRGAYVMHVIGAVICILSFTATIFRVKSWQSNDVTGSQIPFYTTTILEIGFSLMIPCMPSCWTLYRRYAFPDIDDRTTIATPNMKLLGTVASPQTESRSTWRKTHQEIDEIPYRKASRKYNRHKHDPRMKALPATPLPLNHTVPPSPQTPNSFRSMSLPIMFHTASNP